MAEFPRYASKAEPTTQMPSTEAPKDTSGQVIEQIGNIGASVEDMAMKWSNAVDTIQKTVSLSNFKNGMDDITNRAANDPDYNNSQQYFDEINKLKDSNLQGFSSKTAQNEMALNLGYEAKVGQIQVQNLYKKKMIDVGQAKTLDLIKNETDNPSPNSLQTIQNVVKTQVDAGLMHHEDAQKLLEKAENDLGVNRVYGDLNNAATPEMASQVAENVRSGAYETGGIVLSPEEKAKLIKSADVISRQITTKQNFAGRVERQNLVHDLTDQANNGILQGQTLEEAFLNKGISNSTYNSLKENTISPVGPTAGTDHQTYYDLTHYLMNPNVNPEQAIQKILDANSSGKLSRDDQKKLYEMHLIPASGGTLNLKDLVGQEPRAQFDKMKAMYDQRIQQINDKRRWFSPAFQSFENFFTGPNKVQDVVQATQQLVDTVQKGNTPNENIPAEANKIIAQKNVQTKPDIFARASETGSPGHDRFGPVIIYKDGRVVRKK